MRKWTLLAAALALMVTACTSEPEASETTAAPGEPTSSVAPDVEAGSDGDVSLAVDRLAVIDGAGRAVTIDPDGGNPVILAQADLLPFQPVWSPDAAKIAYSSRVDDASFVVVDPIEGRSDEVATPTPMFYYSWAPDAALLAALRNGAAGIQFEFVSVDDAGLTLTEADTGQPYYFDWSPDGSETVVHVGPERLDTVGVDGAVQPLPSRPAAFRAPTWTDRGIIAVAEGDGGQELIRLNPNGDVEVIAEIEGGTVFSVNPEGTMLAIQSFASPGQTDVVEVMLADQPLAPNQLQVIDLTTGEATTVDRDPALAFLWSPVGNQLLVLEPIADTANAQWHVWNGDELIPGPVFSPPPSFVSEFLPFFDQYALSMSLWRPDGSAYAFPGSMEGDAGIWVVDVSSGEATKVSDGTWVAWSPA